MLDILLIINYYKINYNLWSNPMEKKDFPSFEPTIALNYTSAFLEKASFLSSHHKCTLNCLTVIIILINTVPCLLCPSGLHTFHQTLWNDLMRKNNKKKKPNKTWHLTGITTNWGLKYGFIYCWWEIYFYKINAQKFLQKQENNKTRNNFLFLFTVYSTR